ncbi:hypothetical protein C471_16352 [Halorubrum saccharovorum DSM 1137]|uniref:Uncharacterized protein n=1 Tax=Halorubrum saccharovorum DSM 1137 TaxID=1227484 RepID=M0DJW8_9EURY|nr:hypothetical protein [Halorubrum saccharovorum]ELZ35770.1 hypothetical protein C471_16352 [Halorubrum saccharovorum DSM 1137]
MGTRRTAGPTAYRLLVGCKGSPFAPSRATKPVVDVLAGRQTNDAIDAGAWFDALHATRGTVAIRLYLPADHEWWLAYDDGAGDDESPFHRWSTYPSAGWTHDTAPRAILEESLADFDIGRDDDSATIYRSRIVPTRDAPEFVRERVNPPRVSDTVSGIGFGTDFDTASDTESDTGSGGDGDDMIAGESR